jgi:hypothetical protein
MDKNRLFLTGGFDGFDGHLYIRESMLLRIWWSPTKPTKLLKGDFDGFDGSLYTRPHRQTRPGRVPAKPTKLPLKFSGRRAA